jgi:hypothetical protein
VLAVLAAPYALGIGQDTYRATATRLATEAAARHPVDAVALAHSTTPNDQPGTPAVARVQWFANNATRDTVVHVDRSVAKGDTVPLWVDDRGEVTTPPRTAADALRDAALAAAAVWLCITALAAATLICLQRVLDGLRYQRWSRDIRLLVDNGDGRASRNS